VDDHLQSVTLVTRGRDLFRATDIHRLLQALLGYATPDYHHHELMTDSTGRRLAKRDRDVTLRALRAAGKTAAEVREMACLSLLPSQTTASGAGSCIMGLPCRSERWHGALLRKG
jgi:glutamyl-Q tRNA(Asp) synthetase